LGFDDLVPFSARHDRGVAGVCQHLRQRIDLDRVRFSVTATRKVPCQLGIPAAQVNPGQDAAPARFRQQFFDAASRVADDELLERRLGKAA
jgi:hypothetical protein